MSKPIKVVSSSISSLAASVNAATAISDKTKSILSLIDGIKDGLQGDSANNFISIAGTYYTQLYSVAEWFNSVKVPLDKASVGYANIEEKYFNITKVG